MEHANGQHQSGERRTTATGRGSRLRLTLNRMPSIFMVLDPRCSSASRSDARVASASADLTGSGFALNTWWARPGNKSSTKKNHVKRRTAKRSCLPKASKPQQFREIVRDERSV